MNSQADLHPHHGARSCSSTKAADQQTMVAPHPCRLQSSANGFRAWDGVPKRMCVVERAYFWQAPPLLFATTERDSAP